MSTGEPPIFTDPLAQAAALIRDVGRSTQRARRYRALATTVADPIFDRILAIGSEVRRAGRGTTTHTEDTIATAVAELRGLLERCEDAIDDLRAGVQYQEAIAVFASEAAERMASLAPPLFTNVAPCASPGVLYWPVPLAGRETGVHFLPPEDCVADIKAIAAQGILTGGPPLDLGGDDTIRPIPLTDDHDGSESPIALAFEPNAVLAPVCRLEGSSTLLFYANRLSAPFSVCCKADASDEWWDIRPDAYRQYLEQLREALTGFPLRVIDQP